MTVPLSPLRGQVPPKSHSIIARQRLATLFLWKNEGKRYTYARDYKSVELVCALVNLGIAEVKDGKWTLKSAEAARRFLAQETK